MIFLDTSNIEEIAKFMDMGIIRGVTTNPTILHKEGITDINRAIANIAKLVYPHTVSAEVTKEGPGEIILQAQRLHDLSDNVVVKIPIHGPHGEDYLRTIYELQSNYGIPINVTAMMSAQQCLLAAYAGAYYVSLFGGRVNNMGYNATEEIEKLRRVLDDGQFKSQIIVGSVREPLNIIEWLLAGADIITVPPAMLDAMRVHPYTKETVQQFMKDAENLCL